MEYVYLDHAAATPLDPAVRTAMEPYLGERYGNPSSLHELGRQARAAVDAARATIAEQLGARPEEVVFTSSGTEGNVLALNGVMRAVGAGHLITQGTEHSSVLATARQLETEGFNVTVLPVDHSGLVDVKQLLNAVQDNTGLVSIMYANNEIGTVQPIMEIGKELRRLNRKRAEKWLPPVLFHSDACQAGNYLRLNVEELGVDLLTINGSKLYGPKGVGALFVRSGVQVKPLLAGGGQELGRRAGTENVAGIVGLAAALENSQRLRRAEAGRLRDLQQRFFQELQSRFPGVVINGHLEQRLPNNLHFSLPGLDGEAAVIYLSERGFCVSTGAACHAADREPSHVLRATGLTDESASGSLRVTMGRDTEWSQLEGFLEALGKVVALVSNEKLKMKNFESPKLFQKIGIGCNSPLKKGVD